MNKLLTLALVIPPMLCTAMTFEESEANMVRMQNQLIAQHFDSNDLRETKTDKEADSPSWEQFTYFEFGSNQLLYIVPCPTIGASHTFKQGKRGIEIEAGIIYPYSGLIGYVTANYLMFLDKDKCALGVGIQSRFGKVDSYFAWGHPKWTADLSPDVEFIKFFEDGNLLKIQAYIPFNLRVVYGWGF